MRGLAVYAMTDPNAHLVDLVPIPDGTQIVGQITAANPSSLSVMLASGDIATLPCACASILAGLGVVGPGDPIIADLDQHASITSLLRYPDDGRISAKLLSLKGSRISLLLSSGMVKSFGCNCRTGAVAKVAKSAVGKMVRATLNPDAEVVSITVASTPAGGRSTPSTPAPRPLCSMCRNQDAKPNSIGELRPSITSLGVQPSIMGCANSDSAGIFIALRHWRSQTPVLGATVNLTGAASITLASPPSGYVELLNVPSGMYRVTVQKAGLHKVQTADFRVNCEEGVRVQAYLQGAPHRFRIVRIQKRQLVFRVVNRQKAPLNCFYGSAPASDSARSLENTFLVKTAKSYYFCGVKKVTAWKKRSLK